MSEADLKPSSTPAEGTRADEDEGEAGGTHGDDEVASLMLGTQTIELTDWRSLARPCEIIVLTLSGITMVCGLLGDDWVFGFQPDHYPVTAGLTTICRTKVPASSSSSSHTALSGACAAGGSEAALACTLAHAGGVASGLGWTAFAIGIMLGVFYVVSILDERGLLNATRAQLPASLPLRHLATYVPIVCWLLILTFIFLALLAYALLMPTSLGAGLSHVGNSYGLVRLTLLVASIGSSVHLTLVHRVGEDHVVAMLDSLRGHWSHMQLRQKACQVLLGVALVCESLLWVCRVEWGGLLIVYGLWAHSHKNHDHLSLFACAALFSIGTDSLTLATNHSNTVLIEVVTWLLLICKLSVVSSLVYFREVLAV